MSLGEEAGKQLVEQGELAGGLYHLGLQHRDVLSVFYRKVGDDTLLNTSRIGERKRGRDGGIEGKGERRRVRREEEEEEKRKRERKKMK